ncbi:MAG TPA: glycosyltransferase family 4 protein [Alphaproteobacteria bacterium]|nr:glycosyltransferase family 4 protein [Alphaproteobacteria bacterium]
MHILYLHQYFITRAGVGGTRSYEFARAFVAQGHTVTMVTAADDSVPWGGGLLRRRTVDGIDVVELRAGSSNYQQGTAVSYPRRILAFALFALASIVAVLRVRRPDVVFATSTPLTIGIPGMIASAVHAAPMVFEVRDLWPEAPVAMGALRNPLVIRLARWLERTIYRRSAHVVALSPGMADGVIAAGVPSERVSVIPNASDLDLFSPAVSGAAFRQRLGTEGKFVCTYFGAMGDANDLQQVVEAARILQERGRGDVVFVLHGRGKRRPALEAFCARHGLTNVIFSDARLAKHEVAELVAASDLGMTIYRNLPVLYTCSPNKLFDTFAAGRPALVNSPGWLRELVTQHQAGVYARPDDAAHLADQIVRLADDPDLARAYGRNARRLAESRFDRRTLAAQLLEILESAIRQRVRRSGEVPPLQKHQ